MDILQLDTKQIIMRFSQQCIKVIHKWYEVIYLSNITLNLIEINFKKNITHNPDSVLY